jgi:hypothetical protein
MTPLHQMISKPRPFNVYLRVSSRNLQLLIHPIQPLHNHCGRSTTAVADSSHSILAGLQLVEQGHEDTGA